MQYYDEVFQTMGMSRCNPVAMPGANMKPLDEEYVGEDLHKVFRAAVGKLQWAADCRPAVAMFGEANR